MAVQNCIGDAFRGATWVALHNGGGCGWWVGDHPYITSAYELGGWVQKIVIFADIQYTLLFYQIEASKNGPFLVLIYSLSRNQPATKNKRLIKFLRGILEGPTS